MRSKLNSRESWFPQVGWGYHSSIQKPLWLTYQATKSSKSFIRAEPERMAPSFPTSSPINPSPPQTLLNCSCSHTQRLSPFSPLFKTYSCLFSLAFVPFPLPATSLLLATNFHTPTILGTSPGLKAGYSAVNSGLLGRPRYRIFQTIWRTRP